MIHPELPAGDSLHRPDIRKTKAIQFHSCNTCWWHTAAGYKVLSGWVLHSHPLFL